jgi:3,4-dihydroxy 2-butanone 4-phosphate synthase/GTP cyclohydrolase II
MSNNPKKLKGLELAGLEIVERVPLIVPVKAAAVSYLRTKQEKMGHLLS